MASMQGPVAAPDAAGLRIGPWWIRPGLGRGHVATVVFASLTSVAMVVYMGLVQPYVLNEVVRIPAERQGAVTGYLGALQEAVVVLLVGFAGAWSDRVGRRAVYACGFLALAAGYLVYPLAASEAELFAFRLVFAVGVAAVPVMLSTSVQDTPQEVSRGKWIAFNNICQGIGVLLLATVLLGRAPNAFRELGFDAAAAGRLALWSAAAVCIAAAAVVGTGLARSGRPYRGGPGMVRQVLRGLGEARRNPRLAVAYAAAFISRGDLVIVGNFLTLWVTRDGIDRGLATAEASGRAFMIFGIVQVATLAWAAFMGVLCDRLNRVSALAVALALAAFGYTLIGAVGDPYAGSIFPLALLLGVGEVSVIVAGGALLGQEASARERGTIIGVFNLFGGLGIILVSAVSGIVFDAVGRAAPFVMMGALNALLLAAALLLRFAGPAAPTPPAEPGPPATTR